MKKHRKQYFACILCLFFAVSVFGGGLIASGTQWEFQSYADEDRSVAPVENTEQGSEIADGEIGEDEAADADTSDALDADKLLEEIREEIEKLPAIEDLDQLTDEELDTLTADLTALEEKLELLEELLQVDEPEAAALSLLTEEEQEKYEAAVAATAVQDGASEEAASDAEEQDAPKKKKVVALAADDGSGSGLSIETGPAEETEEDSNIYIFPNLVMHVPAGRTVASVTIQFTSAIQSGDSINLDKQDGFTLLDGSKTGNVTVNADGKTKEEWENYLRENLKISLAADNRDMRKLRFTASLRRVEKIYDYNAENGHYYIVTKSKTAISWADARDAAEETTYLGMQGYLATITSESEQKFIESLIGENTWVGATCYPAYLQGLNLTLNGAPTTTLYDSSKGRYFWATGPEAGQAFWEGSWETEGTSYMYTNWNTREPNNGGNYGGGDEYCVHLLGALGMMWNDYTPANASAFAYLVEYGDMPEDKPVVGDTTSDSDSTVEINLDPTSRTLSTKVKEVLTVGETLRISSSFNGKDAAGLLPQNLEIRYTYYKKNAAGKYEPLSDSEKPVHAGEYKVEAKVYKINTNEEASGYTGDTKKFTIKAKELTVEKTYTKVYDGTNVFYPDGDIPLTGIVPGLEQVQLSYGHAYYDNKNAVDDNVVYLAGAVLIGDDAEDYIIKTDEKKGVVVKGKITPKPITITVNSSVTSGKPNQKIDPAPVYTNDLNDAMLGQGDTVGLFGNPVYVGPITNSGVELDLESPAAGTYKVSVTFPDIDETAESNYAVTYKPATINIKKVTLPPLPDNSGDKDDKDGDVNVDTDGDGKPDVNVDTDVDGKPDVNVDTDGDGKPDVNVDTDGDGKPDVNIDTNGDGKPDVNVDTDGDGKPDVNVDTDGDGKPDVNVDTDGDGKPDVNVDTDGDGKPDVNVDTDGDGKPDVNVDTDGDGKPDINIDTNGDGKPDINIDTDGDGIPDLNIDADGDGIPDLNIDADGDGIPDVNVDTDGDGKPDKNIDKDYKSKYDKDDAVWHYPETGDESNLALWVSMLGTSLLALGAVMLLILRRNPVKK